MRERAFILTAVAFASAHGALRGNDNLSMHQRLDTALEQHPQRMLPQKKDMGKLKRINDERKRKNKQARQKRDKDQDSESLMDDEWKDMSKDEKKKLLKQLRDEEGKHDEEKGKSQDKDSDRDETDNNSGGARAQVKPNQLAYLQQYFNHLDDGMELNSQLTDSDADLSWSDLTKEEKKRIKEMVDGELQIKNEMMGDSDGDRSGWKELTKQEKKELLGKGKENDEHDKKEDIIPNSNQATSSENVTSEDEVSKNDESSNEAEDFVIHNRPKPGTLTVEDIMDFDAQNSGNSKDEKEEDMAQNSEQSSTNNKYDEDISSEANDFILPMPSLTFGNDQEDEDQDVSSNPAANNSFASADEISSSVEVTPEVSPDTNKGCPDCFTFAEQLADQSVQLDSFDASSDLDWSMYGLGWNVISQGCYEGTSCIASGINASPDHQEKPVYSNLTLTFDEDFDGGVLIFQLLAKDGFNIPNEAFYVTVDDDLKLSVMSTENKWTEYSVSVGKGKHVVTWSHVYNPLGLEAVPAINAGRLIIDDLRYHPFQRVRDQGFEDKNKGLTMTSDGDATWSVDNEDSVSGKYSILASSGKIKADSGSSNVNFVVYSKEGGTLKFKISMSTTAPHDDFAILLNNKPVDAFFGLMPSFEDQSLEIPMGKVVVTLQHRKNPGKLSRGILDSLGRVKTKSYTRLDDIRFEPK